MKFLSQFFLLWYRVQKSMMFRIQIHVLTLVSYLWNIYTWLKFSTRLMSRHVGIWLELTSKSDTFFLVATFSSSSVRIKIHTCKFTFKMCLFQIHVNENKLTLMNGASETINIIYNLIPMQTTVSWKLCNDL